MTQQSSPLWTASRFGTFQWRQWDDDEIILYHTASGDTHVLSPAAVVVLKELEHATLGFEEILQRVTISADDEERDRLAEHVKRLLDEFDHLGLIEPVS